MTEQTEYVGGVAPRLLPLGNFASFIECLVGMSWKWEVHHIYGDGPFNRQHIADGFAYTKKQAVRRTKRAMRRHHRRADKIAKKRAQACAVRMTLPEES